jgi:hypothetical protein
MSDNQGRQSPPPERQSGRQQQDVPGSGKGTEKVDSAEKKGEMQDQLKVSPMHTILLVEETTNKYHLTELRVQPQTCSRR